MENTDINNSSDIIKLMIVDDHIMFIDGIKSLIKSQKNISVIAEANNGKEAIDKIIENKDINFVITDISMPVMSGIELAKEIKNSFPHIKVLAISLHDDSKIINEIFNAEADGYILKDSGKKELLNAIYKIADDGTYYGNEVIIKLMRDIKKSNGNNRNKLYIN